MSAPVEVTDPATVPAEPAAPEAAEETTEQKIARLEREAAETRREAAKYRTEARDGKAAQAELEKIRESQKTEAQKIQDRAEAAEARAAAAESQLLRETVARRHKIDDEDMDLLGSGTEEEIENRAKRIAALKTAAASQVSALPSERPVAQLRPGATGAEKSVEPPDAYPSSWRTAKTVTTRKE